MSVSAVVESSARYKTSNANKNKRRPNTNLIQANNINRPSIPSNPTLSLGVIFLRDCIQNNSVPIPFSGPRANLPSSRFNYDLICKIDDSYFHERATPIRIAGRREMLRFRPIFTLTFRVHVRLKTFFILFNFVCNQKMTPGPFCVFVCASNGYSFRGWLYNQCLNEFTFRICLIL